MKNIRAVILEKYKDDNQFEKLTDYIYKERGKSSYRITLRCELEPNEDSQYPLDDVLDKYLLNVTDHIKEFQKKEKKILEFELESCHSLDEIKAVSEIVGKRVYNADDGGSVRLVIEEEQNALTENKQKPAVKIKINQQGIFIDEAEMDFPISLAKLKMLLEEPTQLYYENNVWMVIWDNHGIYTSGNLDYLNNLSFLLKPKSGKSHLPTSLFKGEIHVFDEPLENINAKVVKVNKYEIIKAPMSKEQSSEIYCYTLMKNSDYQEPVDTEKNTDKDELETIQDKEIEVNSLTITKKANPEAAKSENTNPYNVLPEMPKIISNDNEKPNPKIKPKKTSNIAEEIRNCKVVDLSEHQAEEMRKKQIDVLIGVAVIVTVVIAIFLIVLRVMY